jgi:hypothetical protein
MNFAAFASNGIVLENLDTPAMVANGLDLQGLHFASRESNGR